MRFLRKVSKVEGGSSRILIVSYYMHWDVGCFCLVYSGRLLLLNEQNFVLMTAKLLRGSIVVEKPAPILSS